MSCSYFTWDAHKFPNSVDMINKVAAKGRKMVTIIDPHIKKDDNYFVHKEATEKGHYVKNKDGSDYEGWCWPGMCGAVLLFYYYLHFHIADVINYVMCVSLVPFHVLTAMVSKISK